MFWKLKYNLWKIRRAANPVKEFRRALWYKLSEHYDTVYPRAQSFSALHLSLLRYGSMALIVIVILGGFGAGAYAYNNPQVGEGNLLYPVKRNLEKIVGQIAQRDPQSDVNFHIQQMQRRLDEIKRLRLNNKALENTISAYNTEAEAGIEKADAVTSSELRSKLIKQVTEEQLQSLNNLKQVKQETKQPEAKTALEKALQKQTDRLEQKMSDLQEKQEKYLEKQLNSFEDAQTAIDNGQEQIDQIKSENDALKNPSPGRAKANNE